MLNEAKPLARSKMRMKQKVYRATLPTNKTLLADSKREATFEGNPQPQLILDGFQEAHHVP